MKKFEYKYIIPDFASANEQEEYINNLGEEGWQLVHFSAQLVFMRELEPVGVEAVRTVENMR